VLVATDPLTPATLRPPHLGCAAGGVLGGVESAGCDYVGELAAG